MRGARPASRKPMTTLGCPARLLSCVWLAEVEAIMAAGKRKARYPDVLKKPIQLKRRRWVFGCTKTKFVVRPDAHGQKILTC